MNLPLKLQRVRTLTSWNRVFLEKFIVAQLVKKFPAFMKAEVSLPCSQQPTSGTYPEQGEVRNLRNNHFHITSHPHLGIQNGLDAFRPKCMHFPLSMHAQCTAYLILVYFITHSSNNRLWVAKLLTPLDRLII
jgi:hypothetical protein